MSGWVESVLLLLKSWEDFVVDSWRGSGLHHCCITAASLLHPHPRMDDSDPAAGSGATPDPFLCCSSSKGRERSVPGWPGNGGHGGVGTGAQTGRSGRSSSRTVRPPGQHSGCHQAPQLQSPGHSEYVYIALLWCITKSRVCITQVCSTEHASKSF